MNTIETELEIRTDIVLHILANLHDRQEELVEQCAKLRRRGGFADVIENKQTEAVLLNDEIEYMFARYKDLCAQSRAATEARRAAVNG